MWSAASRCELTLGSRAAWWRAPGQAVVERRAEGWQQALAALVPLLPAPGGKVRRWLLPRPPRVQVWLSSSLARPFLCTPVPGANGRGEAQALARTQAEDDTGLPPPATVLLHEWRPGRPCLAVAVEAGLVPALQDWAGRVGMVLASVRPWWAEAANRLPPVPPGQAPSAIAALCDEDGLVLLDGCDGGPRHLALGYWPLPPPADRAALHERLQAADTHTGPPPRWAHWRPGTHTEWQDTPA